MNFDKSVLILFSWEGGLVNNPKDPGGVTNFGISQRSYPKLNISTLTKDQASEIEIFGIKTQSINSQSL